MKTPRSNASKIIETIIWIILEVFVFGLHKYFTYQVNMEYSRISANQIVDDSSYGWLQFYEQNQTLVIIIFVLIVSLILFRITTIWGLWKKKTETE